MIPLPIEISDSDRGQKAGIFKHNRNEKTRPIKYLRKISNKTAAALKTALILFSFAGSFSVFANGMCLSPLEMAALFSKPGSESGSYKSRIRKLEKKLSNKNKKIEDFEEDIEKKREEAGDTLTEFTDMISSEKLTNQGPATGYLNAVDGGNYSAPLDIIESYISNRSDKFSQCPHSASSANQKEEIPCYKWQLNSAGNGKNSLFKAKGKIDAEFCAQFMEEGNNLRDCKQKLEDAIEAYEDLANFEKKRTDKIEDLRKDIEEIEDDIRQLRNEQDDAELEGYDEDGTEASVLCTECLEDVRRATGPTGWQRLGSGLTAALGVGLSIFGLREARRAQRSTNELLALQGFPAENNFGYNLAGLSLGYPLMAQGLYGLSRGGMSGGGYGCSPTSSPYGSMNPMMQAQYQAMMTGGMGNPFGGMNPMMQMQFQAMNPFGGMNMNPWGGMNSFGGMNPMMQMQFQAGMNPFGGMGNPWGGMNSFGGMNPMMQMQFQAMNPFGMMNPMMQMQGGLNPWGGMNMNPFGGMGSFGGGNNWAMQQMQMQMQMRMQMQQSWMAQQQAAYQDWMQRQQVIGHLSQQLMQIQSQIQMVMAGGTTSISASGGIPGATPGGNYTGIPGAGGPIHTPISTPSSGSPGDSIEWR